jgi:hypothetical protein
LPDRKNAPAAAAAPAGLRSNVDEGRSIQTTPQTCSEDRRRALELLASSRDGCTEAIMLAHGFTVEQMVELVRTGLASATAERVVAGSRKIEVATVRITEAGRQMLERAKR